MMDVKDSRRFKMFNPFALSSKARVLMFLMGVQVNKAVVTQNKQD